MDIGLKNGVACKSKTMAHFIGPRKKVARRLGLLMKEETARKSKISDYGLRLREKQKVKFLYDVMERQLKRYFIEASRNPANTGLVLLRLLEARLPNVVYRLGFSKTRQQARQIVCHGHITVDDKKVNLPSFQVKIGQRISLLPKALNFAFVQERLAETAENLPVWLTREGSVGKILRLPNREDMEQQIDENLVVEHYSR